MHIGAYTYNLLWNIPTNLQARYDLFCVKSAVKPQPTNQPPYQVPSWSIQQFGHNRHGPKIGGLRPLLGGRAGSPSNTMSLGLLPTSLPSGILMHPAIWPQQIWAENWALRPHPLGRVAWSPSNTMWPGPRPTCKPSFILIHPTVWPKYTNVTDRHRQTDRQTDYGLIA